MEKRNNLLLAQAFILLCAFALPFISLYCQESLRKPVPSKRTLVKRTVKRRPVGKVRPQPTVEVPTPKPENAIIEETPSTNVEEDANSTQITSGTKQTQVGIPAPSAWSNIYRTIAIVLLNSLYKESETGIGAATQILIKRLIDRRDILATKEELEKELVQYSTEQGQNYVAHLNEKEFSKLNAALFKTKLNLEKLEKETSLSAIAATGVYFGILNTAVPMMGLLMGTAIKIGLQMLMPVENS